MVSSFAVTDTRAQTDEGHGVAFVKLAHRLVLAWLIITINDPGCCALRGTRKATPPGLLRLTRVRPRNADSWALVWTVAAWGATDALRHAASLGESRPPRGRHTHTGALQLSLTPAHSEPSNVRTNVQLGGSSGSTSSSGCCALWSLCCAYSSLCWRCQRCGR